MSSFFPDVNFWVALAYSAHKHHTIATGWLDDLVSGTAGFCRLTQLSFLRLITLPAVMREEVKTIRQAWEAYDVVSNDPRVVFYSEPDAEVIDRELRALTLSGHVSTGQWPDAYLAAFASVMGLTLVTFDRGFSRLPGQRVVLLG